MIYFYGGAFDPFTTAHRDIVKSLMKRKQPDDLVVIAVTDNDEKTYSCQQHNRQSIIRRSLDEEWFKNGLTIMPQKMRTYSHLKQTFGKDEHGITIVIGEDELNELAMGKWVHADNLIRDYQFLVFKRHLEAVPSVLNNPNYAHIKYTVRDIDADLVSSTEVRKIFYRNPAVVFKEVQKYITIGAFKLIKDRGLYWQNGEQYAEEEAKFLKDYAVAKEKNGWGEPSVTTDTIAYNGGKILLIRRLKPPFKNHWCLCGGFMDLSDPELKYTAARELKEETNLDIDVNKFHQVKTYSHKFDPRMRIVDVAFEVRVSKKEMKTMKAGDDAKDVAWFSLDDLPPLGFHHSMIIEDWKQKHAENDYL